MPRAKPASKKRAPAKKAPAKRRKRRSAKPRGRPSLFLPEYVEQAYNFAILGATDAELAEHFGVAESTLYEWKLAHPEFSESIKKGKRPADATIAGALFNRASGAEWVEEQAIKLKRVEYCDGKRVLEDERIELVEVVRRAPPDTTAAIFWLKNRRPEQWRDKQEVQHTGDPFIGGVNVIIDGTPVASTAKPLPPGA
jgi:hypothetical protein